MRSYRSCSLGHRRAERKASLPQALEGRSCQRRRFWAAYLVSVQPAPKRDEAGITAVQAAVMVAVPLATFGLSLMVFAWSSIT